MALTPAQRKEKLGFGGLKAIAEQCGVKQGHVSQVNSEKPGKESRRIRDAITAAILQKHPQTDPAEIWPDSSTTEAPKRASVA